MVRVNNYANRRVDLRIVCAIFVAFFFMTESSFAQIEAPDRRHLFKEDRDREKNEKQRKKEIHARKQKAFAGAKKTGLPVDINASDLSYDSLKNKIVARGNVLMTHGNMIAEAREGDVDLSANKAFLRGDVKLTDLAADITAEEAEIDTKTGAGTMRKADVVFVEGNYHLVAAEMSRAEGEEYSLKDALLTTCSCPEGEECSPWSVHSSTIEITRNGYGRAWNSTLRVRDIPLLYVPLMVFPAKDRRQSGLLPISYGNSRRRGMELKVPLYLALDPSTDATVTGLYEHGVNRGAELEFRKAYSRKSQTEMALVYLDESARGDRLLGTDTSGLSDKTHDTHRLGGFLDHNWRSGSTEVPLQFIVDGHYASDDLFIREYEKEEIAKYNARHITSTAVLRAPLGETFTADLSTEFNQEIIDDDDFVFQRIPELNINGLNSSKVFGENPFGLKLLFNHNLSSANFIRKKDYEGQRHELYERVNLPFHLRNILEGTVEGSVRGSLYNTKLDLENSRLAEENQPETTSNRVVPGISSRVGTVVEKVIQLGDDSLIKKISELGRVGKEYQLRRVKHTIEPNIKYRFVPEVDQDENPQFDTFDHLVQKNLVTYGVTQRLLARYEPRNPYLYGIEEATPELKDLGELRSSQPLDRNLNFGYEPQVEQQHVRSMRRGTIQELLQLKVSQTYDIERADKISSGDKKGQKKDAFSDVAADLILFPNDHLRMRTRADFDADKQDFSAYSLEINALTSRGDVLLSRFRFVDSEVKDSGVRQLETGCELKLTDFIRFGYYSRFDDEEGKFIENKGALRFSSQCKCWVLDVDITDKLNPDKTQFGFKVTLIGLGEVGNTFFSRVNDEEQR
jgi:LPS-assembly protein